LDKKWIIIIFYFKRFSYSKIGNALFDELSSERVRQIIKNFQQKLRIKLVLPANNFDNELSSINIKNKSSKGSGNNLISSSEVIKQSEEKFTYSKKIASEEREKDRQIRSELAEIFKEQITEETEIESNSSMVIDSIDLKLKSIVDLIDKNISLDFEINKYLFNELASKYQVTFNVFIDEINEYLYEKYDALLIEIEDDIAYIDEQCLSLLKDEIKND